MPVWPICDDVRGFGPVDVHATWWPSSPDALGDGVQAVAVSNLDAVLLEARETLEALPGHLLADMEALLQLRHLQPAAAEEADELGGAAAGAALRATRRPTAFMPSGRRLTLQRRAIRLSSQP